MPPETHYARSGDLYIAYQVSGTGPMDVVLAPGTVSHLDLDWESPPRASFWEGLSRFCRLIRFDKRGTGLSDRPLQMATLEERADDIRAVLDAAGSHSAAAAYARMNGRIDIGAIVPTLRVPALVMNRSGDPVASVEAARDLAAHIPGARFVEFLGETHSMMTIEPERVLAEIEEFVTGERPAPNIERI